MWIEANLANFCMGYLDGKLFFILIIKTRTEIGLLFFFVGCYACWAELLHVSSLKALEIFDKPKEYIAFWSQKMKWRKQSFPTHHAP
jgi:hypothetical protein